MVRNQIAYDGQLRKITYDLAESLGCPVNDDQSVQVTEIKLLIIQMRTSKHLSIIYLRFISLLY